MKKLLLLFLAVMLWQVFLPQTIKAETITYENKSTAVFGSKQKSAAVFTLVNDLADGPNGVQKITEESAKLIDKMRKEGYSLKSTEMHSIGGIMFVLFFEK